MALERPRPWAEHRHMIFHWLLVWQILDYLLYYPHWYCNLTNGRLVVSFSINANHLGDINNKWIAPPDQASPQRYRYMNVYAHIITSWSSRSYKYCIRMFIVQQVFKLSRLAYICSFCYTSILKRKGCIFPSLLCKCFIMCLFFWLCIFPLPRKMVRASADVFFLPLMHESRIHTFQDYSSWHARTLLWHGPLLGSGYTLLSIHRCYFIVRLAFHYN